MHVGGSSSSGSRSSGTSGGNGSSSSSSGGGDDGSISSSSSAKSSPIFSMGSDAAALESVMSLSAYIAEIQRLEELLKRKQERISQLQAQLKSAQVAGREYTAQMVRDHIAELATFVRQLQERNADAIATLKDNTRQDLDVQIASVDDILAERRCMMREDVTAEMVRELEFAWDGEQAALAERLEKQKELELGISRTTHDKMLREFVQRLNSEAAQAQTAVEESRRESRKRSAGGGIFGWLSPSTKKGRAEDSDDEDEEDLT